MNGKKLGRNRHLGLGAEEDVDELLDRGLHVHHRDALVDDERLELVEHEHVRRVDRVGPIDPARRHHADRRLGLLHHADLDRRGLAAEQDIVLDVEVVQRVAGRMLGRDVQGDEVVPLVLDLRAVGDAEAHPAEDVQQLVDRLHDHVRLADLRPGRRAA